DIIKKDYDHLKVQPRPGHADYVGSIKYKDRELESGGSQFSGRMSAPLVVAGAMMEQIIKRDYPTLDILTHISEFQGIKDYNYYQLRKQTIVELFDYFDIEHCIQLDPGLQKELATMIRPRLYNKLSTPSDILINEYLENDIIEKASQIRDNRDSAGGELETIIMNLPSGIGEPFFYSLESMLSSFIYSIPSIKGISFGSDALKKELGSNVKDEFLYLDEKQAYTLYNFNGGINGGISNGDDIVFKTNIKPISSINQIQYTYNYETQSIKALEINGRHDATIINRIIPIINSVSYIVLAELLYKKLT
ncbi:MAG: chorismate synthase, partial [Erysipelotrichales bacterium]